MLDAETKARIDSARDILVGKVPDPKSQVEQITIALIYKFMDDMDRQSEELGGKVTFFTGEFKKYRWSQLLDKRMGGHERLLLYAEGIEKMNENAGIPQLFRDIFKGVFLPYRDPETLNWFLKEINGFSYDHSERLGDAFEYLLSVLGTQGDAGQFRTPRHIIDFIVSIVEPKKNETVLDPACGTAGFLISAYKHIVQANKDMNPDERARLMTNFAGYDIAPDMCRLSRVNMYLHGFPSPTIHEYDALTSEERWDERFDVILANPPFMTPKGGIRPHNRFAVKAKRSEVLFVDYIAEHLNPGGRAGVVVPEGIIFQAQNAYKNLRRMLVENYLWAVVSLPAGVFNPYSGVKTSILFLDKSMATRTEDILFMKIANDGFGLGAQRRPIEGSKLPDALRILQDFKKKPKAIESKMALTVNRERILDVAGSGLSFDRYKTNQLICSDHDIVPLSRFMKPKVETTDPRKEPKAVYELWSIPAYDAGNAEVIRGADIGSQKKLVFPGEILLSRIIPHIRRVCVVPKNIGDRSQVASTEWIVFENREQDILPEYLRSILMSDSFHARFMQTITGVGGSLSRANPTAVGEIEIPLPPLEEQERIITELDGYRKVIDGARQVVDNYKPSIQIDPAWPVKPLGEIAEFRNGINFKKENKGSGIKVIGVATFQNHLIAPLDELEQINPDGVVRDEDILQDGDILFVRSNGNPALVGRSIIVQPEAEKITHSAFTIRCRLTSDDADPLFYAYLFKTQVVRDALIGRGANISNLSQTILRDLIVPVPPKADQETAVAEMESERRIIDSNRELIGIFENKVQAQLSAIWGES